MSNGKKKSANRMSDNHRHQVAILRSMALDATNSSVTNSQLMISEITERSGLDDEKEVQRYLYILEGQKLVTPVPEGDFTSKHWQITRDGHRALKLINSTATQ